MRAIAFDDHNKKTDIRYKLVFSRREHGGLRVRVISTIVDPYRDTCIDDVYLDAAEADDMMDWLNEWCPEPAESWEPGEEPFYLMDCI